MKLFTMILILFLSSSAFSYSALTREVLEGHSTTIGGETYSCGYETQGNESNAMQANSEIFIKVPDNADDPAAGYIIKLKCFGDMLLSDDANAEADETFSTL